MNPRFKSPEGFPCPGSRVETGRVTVAIEEMQRV